MAPATADAMVSDPGALRKRAHGEHGVKSPPTASTSGQDEKVPLEEETLRFSFGSMAGVFLCAAGILGPLVLYGILQERVMTRPYGEPWCLVSASLLLFPGLETPSRIDDKHATLLSLFWVEGHGRDGDYFKHSLLIVLLNRLLTCLAALATHLVKRERIRPLAPISAYALVSFSNVVATSCQYEALK